MPPNPEETDMIAVPETDTWRKMWADVAGGWLCADGFWGVPHPDGRYLFLCGDTAHETDGRRWWTRTSAVTWDGKRLENCSDADIIPTVARDWHWGGPMVWGG